MGEEIRFNLKDRKSKKLSKKIAFPVSEENSTICVEEDVRSIASESQSSEHSYEKYSEAYNTFAKEIPETVSSNDASSVLSDESMDTEPAKSTESSRKHERKSNSNCDTTDASIAISAVASKKSNPQTIYDPTVQHKYELAQLSLRLDKLEAENKNRTLDSCFNIVMANLENLNPSQRKSLLFGLLAMMK
nr:NSP5 [Bat RVJ-like rotavirus BtSY3]